MTAETTTEEPGERRSRSALRRFVRRLHTRGARSRILASYLILLVFATFVSLALIRQVLVVWLDDRIERELVQETEEFKRLAAGVPSESLREARREVPGLFDLYLRRNVPDEGEAVYLFRGDRLYDSTTTERATLALSRDPTLVARWTSPTEPRAGSLDTEAGPVRYLSVPVRAQGETVGTFVVAYFTAGERQEVNDAVRLVTIVMLVVLLLGSVLAWFAAGRVLAPLRRLDRTARQITESDLTRRIPVRGSDEIAELGRTFNAMLDRLEAAFGSQREFLQNVSHELRTPLTIVRGHLEVMGPEAGPEERRETLALVTDELERMSRLVEDLLVLARAEQPDFLQPERVDLAELTREIAAKAEHTADREWHLEHVGTGMAVADRHRLTQAMLGLVDNAVKHTEPGERIALGSARDGRWVRLWVHDRGVGIDPSRIEQLLTRKSRGETARRRYEGSGLGLAIVRAVAEAHRGRVQVDGAPGRGARFEIVLPIGAVTQGRADADKEPTRVASLPAGPSR